MRVLRLLLGSLDQYRKAFVVVFVVGMLDGAVTFFVPVLLAEYTKHDFSPDVLRNFVPWLVVCFFVSHALQWILRRYGESFGPRYAMHLRLRYFKELGALPLASLNRRHSGYLLSLVNAVADGLGNLAIEMFWGVSRSMVNLTLFFYFTARESVTIAVANTFVLIAFVALSGRLSKRM